MKHWWAVTGFRRAISGTTPSLDITLRGWDLASFMHNTADIHSLNFAAHSTPFHPTTPPSSWAMISLKFHSLLYIHPHQYLLQAVPI